MIDASGKPSKPRRRWFQFSRRALLIAVTLAAGLLVAWRVYVNVEHYRWQRETMKLIEELGGSYTVEPGGPSWLRGLFGEDNFQNIIRIQLMEREVSDSDLAHLEGLTNLQFLNLTFTPVSDAGLAQLGKLTTLEELILSHTQVSDAGLEHIARLTNLRELFLDSTQVSDAGMAHLKGLTNLEKLDLTLTQVSDAGLAPLKGLIKLEWLWLNATHVTDAGVQDLRKALPNCGITHFSR